MRTITIFALACLTAPQALLAQTAYTTPVGYTSQTLAANQFNLVGLTLHGAPLASGAFTTVSGTTLTDTNLAITPTAGRHYVLEILNGTFAGTIQELASTAISGTTITTPDNLGSLGLLVGDKYSIRLAPTLEEIFGVDVNSVLARSLNSSAADIVWIPNGAGSYNQYFVHSSTSAFRIAGTITPAPNVPIIYTDGLLVQKRSTASTLTVSGNIKTIGSNSVAIQGFNLISTGAPTGLTLFTSGLANDLAGSLNPISADLVWVPTGTGTYTQYFRHTSGNWRDVAASTVNLAADVALPSAVLIQRRSATPANISLDVPTAYSGL